MNLTNYAHKPYMLKPNKTQIPINEFQFENVKEFNEIYMYAYNHFIQVKPTASQGISYKKKERFSERYFVIKGNQYFELVIICYQGCYRFRIKPRPSKDNDVSGRKACRTIYEFADKYGINFNKYATSKEEGLAVKATIEKPHIQVMNSVYLGKHLSHVYHMDFRSSYASRISEAFPELRKMYEEIYSRRKENNGYYKHVLSNSIGCWQSPHCVDYYSRSKSKPFQFAKLSKVANNGTRAKIEEKLKKLTENGYEPILTNTDGIWYYSNKGPYHDEEEGNALGCWENDHLDCEFIMINAGAYQYEENGVCKSVVRGLCSLDAQEPDRDKWQFGDILRIKFMNQYKFIEGIGVIKDGKS